MLALVMREERLDKAGAIEWLGQQGFLRKQDGRPSYPASSAQSRSAQSTGRSADQHRNTLTPEQRNRLTLSWIRSQVLPIADAPGPSCSRLDAPAQPLARGTATAAVSALDSEPMLRSSEERTQGQERSRFHLLQLALGERPTRTRRHQPRCSSSASTPMASAPTTRTPRAAVWTSRSSATPDKRSGPSGIYAETALRSVRERRTLWLWQPAIRSL